MKRLIVSLLFISNWVLAEGLVIVPSQFSVEETKERLLTVLEAKGMTIFAQIDHTAGAQKIGQDLTETQLVIFGNPKVGTPLMQCASTIAIDLPQKALIWQDENSKVWFGYNQPQYLAKRHELSGSCLKVIKKVEGALSTFAKVATQG